MHLTKSLVGLSLVGICGLASVSLCPHARAQAQGAASGGNMDPHAVIDTLATQEKAEDEGSVRALADGIFSHPHVFPRMPAELEQPVKDRLVRAETLYLQGKGPGVQEQDVVSLLNTLAEKLGAPDYAKTSVAQVRYLRLKLAVLEPTFMGKGAWRPNTAVGQSMPSTMSPLQAVHLLGLIVDLKVVDPRFQVTVERWTPPVEAPAGSPVKGTLRAGSSSPHETEMRSTLAVSISQLTLSDASQLMDQAFTTLKID